MLIDFIFNIKGNVLCVAENRLKRIKGQSNEVTSREMLRSLSQAKKECWDRFLHDAQTSELFQEGDLDQRQVKKKSFLFLCGVPLGIALLF